MDITSIPYTEKSFFSDLIQKYLAQDPLLDSYYGEFPSIPAIHKLSGQRDFADNQRQLLYDVLCDQHGRSISESQRQNLELMKESKTRCVTTGHQLCLFGGPLYFFLKIISCINLAKELNQSSDEFRYVPVFWMATEDHDFEEINHIHLFGKEISWQRENGAHVGDLELTGIEEFRATLFQTLGESEYANELKGIFDKAYHSKKSLSEATRTFVQHFFAPYGLLILDANNAKLKASFKKIFIDEIKESIALQKVGERVDEMKTRLKIQANPRDINLFYLTEKERKRIDKQNNSFSIGERKLSKEELLDELEKYPEKFSPNVLMRPLYQEYILPNVAYVGGGGEIAYWLELKLLFDHYGIQFPSLVLRNSILWIDSGSAKKISKLGLTTEELFLETEQLIKTHLERHIDPSDNLDQEEKELKAFFERLRVKMSDIDPTLASSVSGEEQRMLKSLKKFEGKIIKSYKMQMDSEVNSIRRVKEKLFPANGLQERYDNFAAIYLKHGADFISLLMDELNPLELSFKVIKEP